MSQNDKLYQIFLSHPEVTSDTRALIPNGIFFALKGGNFDGNQFAAQALEGGCAYAVVDNPAVVHSDRYILVDDVLTAMQQLAARHRRELSLPILQVTGTNGKTTTKELLAAVLGRKFRLLYTQGNLNNHIGVPKTLLRLRPEHQLAIIETGANHPGEIADLCRIVQADCGVITNVGMAHLEGFGSFEGVVRTKSELYDDLRQRGGYIFLHGEDDILRRQAVGLPAVTYGLTGHQNAVEGEVVACDPCLRFRWRRAGGDWNCVPTQLIGAYNISNALCAVSAGIHFGVPDADINAAISEYCPTNNRSELLRTAHNTLIVELKPEGGNHAALCQAACDMLDTYEGLFCLESFDPRCIRWLKKNRPDLIRGQLTDYFVGKANNLNPALAFLLSHNMLNFLGRPDFVAYRYSCRGKTPTNWVCEKVLGMQAVTWTLKSQEEHDDALSDNLIPIFEDYLP